MRAKAWAHRRVTVPEAADVPLAEVAGDGRARLRIRFDRAEPAAPIRGALSYPASWRAGRWADDAVVSVIPQWSWGYELHFAVAPPGSFAGRMVWRRRRLERLANGLASALRDASEGRIPKAGARVSARTAASRRWSLDAAAGNSSSR